MSVADLPPISPLPAGITSRIIDTQPRSLSFHILEAGAPPLNSPPHSKDLILLLHGYPELAYSWRKVMPFLANAGYHVIAPDQRGYGRTTGWDTRPPHTLDGKDFSVLNLVRDMIVLVNALGYNSVKCVCGHDFGAVSASLCALTRPDFFQSLVIMSHPFKGSPTVPFNSIKEPSAKGPVEDNVHAALAALPEPRKHYKWYNCTPPANHDWTYPTSGIHEFLRGYFHLKSADWAGNDPHPLKDWTAEELAKMPYYYILPLHMNMREAIAAHMKDEDPAAVAKLSSRWLPDEELAVYTREFSRNTFQGGLNWYNAQTNPLSTRDLDLFAGSKLRVPTRFISGKADWGTYQEPGAVEGLESGKVCTDYRGTLIVDGAGHWVNSEQPEVVAQDIVALVKTLKPTPKI